MRCDTYQGTEIEETKSVKRVKLKAVGKDFLEIT